MKVVRARSEIRKHKKTTRMTANNTKDSEMPRNAIHGSELRINEVGSNLPKA